MKKGRRKKTPCQAAQPSILTLPDELLARILGRLSFKDKVLCQLLSRRFNALLSCPGNFPVWGTIPLDDLPQLYNTVKLARQETHLQCCMGCAAASQNDHCNACTVVMCHPARLAVRWTFHRLHAVTAGHAFMRSYMLYTVRRWLIKRRGGIVALTYSRPSILYSCLISGKEDPQRLAYRAKHFHYALQTLPVLAVALPVTELYLEEGKTDSSNCLNHCIDLHVTVAASCRLHNTSINKPAVLV